MPTSSYIPPEKRTAASARPMEHRLTHAQIVELVTCPKCHKRAGWSCVYLPNYYQTHSRKGKTGENMSSTHRERSYAAYELLARRGETPWRTGFGPDVVKSSPEPLVQPPPPPRTQLPVNARSYRAAGRKEHKQLQHFLDRYGRLFDGTEIRVLGIMEIAQILGEVNEVIQSIPGTAEKTADEVIADLRSAADNNIMVGIDPSKLADLIETLVDNGLVTD